MSLSFEESKKALNKLVEEGVDQKKINEATTRLRFIDSILFDCLGWERKQDCVSEENLDNTYVDYLLGKDGKKCVIEAKKAGIYFELPVGVSGRIHNIKTLCEGNKSIEAAIKQALTYSQMRGISIGVVCNGHQIIAFIASRQDGTPPMDGKALIFISLKDMFDNFREFWDNLSKPAVETYRLLTNLKDSILLPPNKLSQKINSYPGFRVRNDLQTELKILGDLFIEDITTAPELEENFLKECYCSSGALSQYALVSRQIIEARFSLPFQKEIHTTTESVNTKKGINSKFSADILSASISRRPIILLGDVGTGKTAFIRNFIKLEAADLLKRALVLYIDFGNEPALPNDLSNFVISSCKKQLLKEYEIDIEANNFIRGTYDLELKRFSHNSIYSKINKDSKEFRDKELLFLENKLKNPEEHLKASFEHIWKGQNRQIIVFLDNIDQRPLEFQDQVFLIGQGIASSWPSTVFISLRPDTFLNSQKKGSLTAYQPRVFTISPPRIDLVILKRLNFVLKKLIETNQLKSLPEGIKFNSDKLKSYIEVILRSFKENTALIELIDNLCDGNIRLAINFLSSFIGSGHVNTSKILELINRGERYVIPVHEFLRAIIFGDNEYYNPMSSPIPNIFDISSPDGKEHFLLPIILSLIEKIGISQKNQGFVTIQKIYEQCQLLGFQPLQIKSNLERAVMTRVLESNPKYVPLDGIQSYRITTSGAYMIKKMLDVFTYFDAIVVDTPIIDSLARTKINNEEHIEKRLQRTLIFLNYLDDQWRLLSNDVTSFDWMIISSKIKKNIESIKVKLERAKKQ